MSDTYKCERCRSVFECSHALSHHVAMVDGGNHCCHRCYICSPADSESKCIKKEGLEQELAILTRKRKLLFERITRSTMAY